MKTMIFKILIRLLGRPAYHPLSQNEVNSLLTRLAKEEGFERLPDYLQQCADTYRNQYLYSDNVMFKGSVLAFTQLREQILEKRKPKKKKSLTDGAENAKIPVY